MSRNISPVVKNIIIINIIMYLAVAMLPTILGRLGIMFDVSDVLGMHYFGSDKFNVAQLITYMFIHAPFPNFSHVFFNMFAVFMFGPIIEYVWGAKKFLFFYLFTGLGAALIQQLFWFIDYGSLFSAFDTAIKTQNSDVLLGSVAEISKFFHISGDISKLTVFDVVSMKEQVSDALLTVGASGAVFGILLAFGWLFPDEKMFLLFLPIPIKARYFVMGYAVMELFLGVANFSGDSVAHFAHLGGMIFGVLIMLYWRKKGRLYH